MARTGLSLVKPRPRTKRPGGKGRRAASLRRGCLAARHRYVFETHQLPVPAADLRKRLEPLVRKTQAFKKRIAHKGIWVEPKLLAEIEYRAKSAEGKVRHPFFRGLREDL